MTNPARHYEIEVTPVDDVRKVRERLSREAANDVRKLAHNSAAEFDTLKEKLKLKLKEKSEH